MLVERNSINMQAIIASVATKSDPVGALVQYLEDQRIPPQGKLFYSQTVIGIALHTG